MKGRKGFGILLAVSVALVSFGCEGDTGPQGPEGPEGPEGPAGETGVSEFAYQGDFGSTCLHCHATVVNEYVTTGHRFAYDDLDAESQANLYCIQCHTTGFNCTVNFGDTEIDPANCWEPDDGYSGYIGDETEEGAERRLALEGVQCESCHDAAGPELLIHAPALSFSTHDNPVTGESTSLCVGCHDHQIDEWKTSGHANAAGGDILAFNEEHYAHIGSCQGCHTSEGYIAANDPAFANYDFGHEVTFIGCPTCHDPHIGVDGGGNDAQLRNLSPVELSYVYPWAAGDPEAATMEGYGPGQTCAQCHKARRDNANVANQIANGYGHFGPHASPQADMFIGAGSYEIPTYTYDGTSAHQAMVTDGCVTCHMTFTEDGGGHLVHDFNPSPANCAACHPGLTDFDYNGVQTEIKAKLDLFAVLLGYADADDLAANINDETTGNTTWPEWQREAAYGFIFVYNSGDLGVHNSNYARSLIDNAIDYAGANLP